MLGGARQFVFAPESCQRLPELNLLAGSMVTYLAATLPAVPTGFWDRNPKPTPGRLRRLLARTPFPNPHHSQLRMVKDAEEIGCIRAAAQVVDAGMQAAVKAVKPGITESPVAAPAQKAI